MLIKFVLMLAVVILQRVIDSSAASVATKHRMVWPPGMTYLMQSTAGFSWMDKDPPMWVINPETNIISIRFSNLIREANIYFSQHFTGVNFFIDKDLNHTQYPEIASTLPLIKVAQSSVTHENLDMSLDRAINHIYYKMLLIDKNAYTDCYIYIWAFLGEYGRHITDMTLKGQEFHESYDQQIKIRALDALRAGIEKSFQARYPDLCIRLACSNVNNPIIQLSAMEELIKNERETHMTTREQRMALFNDWHQILLENNIARPNVPPKSLNNKSSPLILNAMREVMNSINCPWWHAPLKYIPDTRAGHLLCITWQYSSSQVGDIGKNENINMTDGFSYKLQ